MTETAKPVPGEQIVHDGQTFTCVAIEPYTNRLDEEIELARWLAACPMCGDTFTTLATFESPKFARRCKPCRDLRGPFKLSRYERKRLR